MNALSESTATLRRQHAELFELSQQLAKHLDPAYIAEHATDVRLELARFLGKLRVHAAMENDALYPRLFAHTNPQVRAKAKELFDEVGPVYDVVTGLAERFKTTETVAADPAAFVRATKHALRVLGDRVMRETNELYPLADLIEA